MIGGILCERCEISKEVIYEKIGHGFLLSFLVIPLSPFNSFLIHFVDSMLIIIFDKYFHEVWNMEKKNREFLLGSNFMNKLDGFIKAEKDNITKKD